MILAKVRRFWWLYVIIGILGLSFVWEAPKASAVCTPVGDGGGAVDDNGNYWTDIEDCMKAEAGDTTVKPTAGPSVKPESNPTFPTEEEEGGGGASDKELYKKCTDYMDLAWWVCPVLVNAAKAADSLMKSIDDGFVKSEFAGVSLIIKKDYLENNSDTHKLWRELMNFVNIGLIIVLLIIIFSQLTGYGIDNYGIKKMLPKVVVAAIIMNLSFLICQIAVDAVNIIGKGVISMAKALPVDTEFGWLVVLSAIFGIGALGVATGGISTIALVIFLIVAAISGIITYTTFILSVGVWSLLTVALIVVSPLAIFCHILPNTEKYFKYWWKIFMGCLVFYPIVAGLYALSTIMRGIAFSNGDEKIVVMIGLMMGFIPFYFAPKILKKTLVGLDGIGVAMAGLVAKTARTAKKGTNLARKSPPGQNLEKNIRASVARSNMKAYERVRGNKGSTRDKIQNFFAGGQSGYLRSRALLNKTESEDRAAELLGARDEYRNKGFKDVWDARSEAARAGNNSEVARLDTYGYDRFGGKWTSRVASELIKHDPSSERQRGNLSALQRYFEDNKDFAAAVKKSSTAGHKLVINGGKDEKDNPVGYDYFDEHKNNGNSMEDWATQNKDSIERAYKNKSLTPEVARGLVDDATLNSRLDGDARKYINEEILGRTDASTISQASTDASVAAAATAASAAATAASAVAATAPAPVAPQPPAAAAAVPAAPAATAPAPVVPQPPAAQNHATPQSSSLDGAHVTIKGDKINVKGSEVNLHHPSSPPASPINTPPNSNQQGQK